MDVKEFLVAEALKQLTPEMVGECRIVLFNPKQGTYFQADADIVYEYFAERFRRENKAQYHPYILDNLCIIKDTTT